jgi:Zn-dependent protease with chaperone function
MRNYKKQIFIFFIIPMVSLVFFQFAPKIYGGQVRKQFHFSNTKNTKNENLRIRNEKYINSLDFVEICSVQDDAHRDLVAQLHIGDVCQSFKMYFVAEMGALFLIFIGLIQLFLIWSLAQAALKSKEALIFNLKLAWSISIFLTLINLLGQTILTSFTTYYASIVILNKYSPKLIFFLFFSGSALFVAMVLLLFKKYPIKSEEKTSELISPERAPKLWQLVNELALAIKTAPPQNILIGVSTAFYVTEAPVIYVDGTTSGRTLFLSEPMMRTLSLNDLKSIIGHELGHFKGADTQMTLELVPVLIKLDKTLAELSAGGWVARPTFYAFNLFYVLFENSIGAFRREREFVADSVGALVTSTKIMSQALVKYIVMAETHEMAVDLQIRNRITFEQALTDHKNRQISDERFWENLSDKKAPHPFDSHPPLFQRVEKLGYNVDEFKSYSFSEETQTAYQQLFNSDFIIAKAQALQSEMISVVHEQVKIKDADLNNQNDREMLKMLFPDFELNHKFTRVLFLIACFGFTFIVIPAFFMFFVKSYIAKFLNGLICIFSINFISDYYKKWKSQKLMLTFESIQLSSWHQPIFFKDIKEIDFANTSYTAVVIFRFFKKRVPLETNPFLKLPKIEVSIDLVGFPPSAIKVAEKIYQYYYREKPVDQKCT